MEAFVQLIFNALSLASIYIIVAIGLQVIFGLMGIINLAHGEFLLIGAYVTFLLQSSGVPFLFSVIASILVACVVGYVLEKSVIRLFYDKPLDTLLVTWGISIVLREATKIIFGADPKPLATPISGGLELGGVIFPYWRTVIILTSIVIVFIMHYVLNKSDLGLQIRATLENKDLSQTLGINVNRMYQITFIIGAVIASIAGAIVIPLSSASPETGITYLLPSFLVVILGGFTSLIGVIWGGLFIAGISTILTLFMSSVTAEILVFLIVIIALRFRPEGLFARRAS